MSYGDFPEVFDSLLSFFRYYFHPRATYSLNQVFLWQHTHVMTTLRVIPCIRWVKRTWKPVREQVIHQSGLWGVRAQLKLLWDQRCTEREWVWERILHDKIWLHWIFLIICIHIICIFQDMKWIEEKQALYKRNQELVEKVGEEHHNQSMFKMFLLITRFKFLKFDMNDFGKLSVKTKKASLLKLQRHRIIGMTPKWPSFSSSTVLLINFKKPIWGSECSSFVSQTVFLSDAFFFTHILCFLFPD